MSRVGKQPIKLPSGVTITVDEQVIKVDGPKGSLTQAQLPGIKIEVKNGEAVVSRQSEEWEFKAKHGLMRTLVANMVKGVSEGFSKKLEINGVGFRVAMAGAGLKFNLGYSHDINYALPQGIQANVEQNTIVVSGIDKQQVGQVAAEIRALRKPEPYKGKGIKYAGERILRKSGKSGKEKA
jgi:large subunit ribosomal protein L6